MPILLIIIAVLLIVAAINDKMGELGDLVKEDFAPSDPQMVGFPVWLVALFSVGALGYVKELRPISNGFLALVIVGIILSNRGFFTQFKAAIEDL